MDALDTLKTDYQILTELHSSEDARTYLARHLTLNRDVTLTVVHALGDRSFLTAFARDVDVLKASRDQNLVPIVEGRWLDDQTYAVARARVRGSTLDQLMSAVGTMPPDRIATALREITSAIVCARNLGVTSRRVAPESITFQQGTGKALVAFEPSRLVVDDAQTIRELASTMSGGKPVDVSEYLAMLAPSAAAVAATIPATAPVGREDSVVVVQQTGMSFTARVLTAFAVIAAVVVGGLLFMNHRKGSDPSTTATTQVNVDTSSAAGDLPSRTAPIDTNTYPTPTIVEPPTPAQPPMPSTTPYPSSGYPASPYPANPYPTNPYPTQPVPLTTNPTPIPQPQPTAPRTAMPTPLPQSQPQPQPMSPPVSPPRPAVDTVIRRHTLIRRDSVRPVAPATPIDTIVRPKPDSVRPDTTHTARSSR